MHADYHSCMMEQEMLCKNAKCDAWKQTCKKTCQANTVRACQAVALAAYVGEKLARSKHENTQSGSTSEPLAR